MRGIGPLLARPTAPAVGPRNLRTKYVYTEDAQVQKQAQRLIALDEDYGAARSTFKNAFTAMENTDEFENAPRKIKSVDENRFLRYIMRAMSSNSFDPSKEEFRRAAERAHVGRRVPGEEGRDFDAEDVLELMHDPNIFGEDDWRNLRHFLDVELVPLLRSLDPLDLFLDPKVFLEWEKKGPSWGPAYRPYHHWQILREERRNSAVPPTDCLREMLQLHLTDPLRWPYERLAATYGLAVDTVKYYLLQEYSRVARATGKPYKYSQAAAHLFKREIKELEKSASKNLEAELHSAVSTKPRVSKSTWRLLVRQARHKELDRNSCGFYKDSRLWKATMQAQQASEPSVTELRSVAALGADPEVCRDEVVAQQDLQKPPAVTEIISWAAATVPPRFHALTISPYHREARKNAGVLYLPTDHQVHHELHLVREPEGTLRQASIEERKHAHSDEIAQANPLADPVSRLVKERYMQYMLRKWQYLDPAHL